MDSARLSVEQRQTGMKWKDKFIFKVNLIVDEVLQQAKVKFGLENSKLALGLFLPPPQGKSIPTKKENEGMDF